MWLLKNSEGNSFICRTTRGALELMESNLLLVWTTEFVKVYESIRASQTAEVNLNTQTGKISERRKSESAAVPLGRSGDVE